MVCLLLEFGIYYVDCFIGEYMFCNLSRIALLGHANDTHPVRGGSRISEGGSESEVDLEGWG